jgi:hypothetical protein
MSAAETLNSQLERIQTYALGAAIAGLVVSAGAGVIWPGALFPAYLVAFLFWVGIALGCISLLLLHNITGGMWGLMIRRPLEAGAMTIVPMAVLFVPIALGLKTLYPWARPDVVKASPAILHKAAYLNEYAFLLRAGIGFAVWIAIAWLLHYGAIRRAVAGNGGSTRAAWLIQISAPMLGIVFFTGSFAAIDWGMSLEPEWYSTIYGVMVIVGWGLLTFATMILVSAFLARSDIGYREAATPSRVQDLGNLMLAFVMLWAYMSFSQFLIIWCGNLTEEIPWYLRRTKGGWQYVALALITFHFFVPFFALLFRDIKRKVELLMFVAAAIIVMHLVDLSWLVLPAPYPALAHAAGEGGPRIPWGAVFLVPVAVVGIGGASVWAFLWHLQRRPLVPEELLAATAHEHGS